MGSMAGRESMRGWAKVRHGSKSRDVDPHGMEPVVGRPVPTLRAANDCSRNRFVALGGLC